MVNPLRYVANPAFAAEAVRATTMRDLLTKLVQAGAEVYHDSVPVESGALQDSTFSDVQLVDGCWTGRIGATVWYAALVELGTSKREPDGSLRRAAEAIGLQIQEQDG